MTATANGKPKADRDEIRRALDVLFQPGDVIELRAPKAGKSRTISGYFDDLDRLASAAVEVNRQSGGVYVTLNPTEPALLARRANRWEGYASETTNDSQVPRRRWLLIDADARRPAGISSTDEEHTAAIERLRQVWTHLVDDLGWPEPVAADSGNGGHLLFRVDLPGDDGGLLQRLLVVLDERFSDEIVSIDTTVFNPARIVKLYGTVAGKGDHTADRPHRVARLLHVPDEISVVPPEKLEALAGPPPEPPPRFAGHARQFGEKLDVDRYLAERGVAVLYSKDYACKIGRGRKWVLKQCVWCGETDKSAFVLQFDDGRLSAGCQHDRCTGRGWHDFRDAVEPGWRDRRNNRPLPSEPEVDPEVDGFIPPGGNGQDHPGSNGQGGSGPKQREQFRMRRISAAELDAAEFAREMLVENMLVAREPIIFAGWKKQLKTSLAVDLAISLAHGGFFLGKFKCPRAVHVGLVSGESGMSTLQETSRRICRAAGLQLADLGGLVFSDTIPRISNAEHKQALLDFCQNDELEVLILDPAYLMMPGGDAGNLFVQGEMLRELNTLCTSIGVTLILVHHNKKNRDNGVGKFDPPELEDIAWAGYQEYARQWILIGRREPYEPGSGLHKLHLNTGGSAGFSSWWAVDVFEGLASDPDGRVWEVDVQRGSEARDDQAKDRESGKETKQRQEDEAGQRSIIEALAKLPRGEGVFRTRLYELTGIGDRRLGRLLAQLQSQGIVEPCEALRSPSHNTPQSGAFRLTEAWHEE